MIACKGGTANKVHIGLAYWLKSAQTRLNLYINGYAAMIHTTMYSYISTSNFTTCEEQEKEKNILLICSFFRLCPKIVTLCCPCICSLCVILACAPINDVIN